MAFPFLSEENFEEASGSTLITGTTDIPAATHFDSAADTDGIMSLEHFSETARTPGIAMPYRGAYHLRIDLNGGTNDASLTETASWDTALDGTIYHRMMVWFGGPNVAMANNDLFTIFNLESTGSVIEVSAFIFYTTAGGYQIGANETASTSGAATASFSLNTWHCVELASDIDDGGSNDGSIILYLDGHAVGTVSSLDQAAIVEGSIGAIGPDAGTSGTLLIDSITADDARLFEPVDRFSKEVILTKSGHVMLGPGMLTNMTLLSGTNTDQHAYVYDTNVGQDSHMTNLKLQLYGEASTSEIVDPAGVPLHLERGAYIVLSGTQDSNGPRAIIQIAPDVAYGSDGAIRNYGLRI